MKSRASNVNLKAVVKAMESVKQGLKATKAKGPAEERNLRLHIRRISRLINNTKVWCRPGFQIHPDTPPGKPGKPHKPGRP